MKNKYTILFGLMLLSAIILTGVQAIEAPVINISLMNQDPDPVGPGEYVELRFKIENNRAGTVATNFEVMLDPVYPFSLDSNENALRSIGDLPALGSGGNVVIIKFKIRVDENVIEGDNPIRIKYRHINTDWISREFDVNVQTRDANLAIVSVTTVPEMIKPGEKVTLKIKVQNMADSTMKDISLKLDLTFSSFLSQVATLTATDSIIAFNSLPFAPIGSATEQKIFSLAPGGREEFTYELIAYSDADSKVYKVPIILTYYDELETQYTKSDIIGLIVGTKPDMSVILDETDLYVGKQSGIAAVRFINKGFSDVKFLDVILDETDEFELLSASEVYVGNVDSDDYETAEFNLYLKNGATKKERTVILPINVEYRDTNNNLYKEKYDLELRILNPEKLGQGRGSSFGLIVIILVVIVAVVFYYRRRKKKR